MKSWLRKLGRKSASGSTLDKAPPNELAAYDAIGLDHEAGRDGMLRALLFNDVTELTEFVRLWGDGEVPGPWTLLRLRCRGGLPSQGGLEERLRSPTPLLLLGSEGAFDDPGDEWIVGHCVEALYQDDEVLIEQGELNVAADVVGRLRERRLTALVHPSPWTREPERPELLIFRLADPSRLAPLVRKSLHLGNDRIRYAHFAADGEPKADASSGADEEPVEELGEILLRFEEPSYFLLQEVLEVAQSAQGQGGVRVYYPIAPDVYLPWGYTYPLLDVLRDAARPGPAAPWIFFEADGARHALEMPRWHDIYDATRFELPRSEAELRRQTAADFRFDVRLRLVPRANPVDGELWLLRGEEVRRLEQLVAGLPESELYGLLVSVYKEKDGERLYWVRERGLKESRFFDFGGRAYRRFQGLANLLIPVDQELEPLLRRDRYRDIFGLKTGELVILDSGERSVLVQRIAEKSFEPLEALVDYLAAEAEQALARLEKASIFDLGAFARAPKRPDLALPSGATRGPASSASTGSEAPASEASSEVEESGEPTGPTGPRIETPEPLEPPPETQESTAERAVLEEADNVQAWLELIDAKVRLGKYEEACVAYVDALWLVRDEKEALPLITAWRRLVDSYGAKMEEEDICFVRLDVLRGRHCRPHDVDRWLAEAAPGLIDVEHRLRLKERWLLWREVLVHSRDVRRLARLREEIRNHLHQGLDRTEIPSFLQRRLFEDSRFQVDPDAASVEAKRELAAAERNLKRVVQGIESFGNGFLSCVGKAMAAATFGRTLGRRDETRRLTEEARGLSPVDLELRPSNDPVAGPVVAWFCLYMDHALRLLDAEQAKPYRALLKQQAGRLTRDRSDPIWDADGLQGRRESTGNAAAFLSQDNAQRFFPSGKGRQGTPIGALAHRLRTAPPEHVGEHLAELFDGMLKPPVRLDPVDLAELLDAVLRALGRIRLQPSAPPLFRRLEQVSDELMNLRVRGHDIFYGVLRNNSLAKCQLELGRERRAAELVEKCFKMLAGSKVMIDVIDGCSALLTTVESMGLEHREPLMGAAMDCLVGKVQEGFADQFLTTLDRQFFRLIDQACESAVSKERLALELFRQYCQDDEFLILDRIASDDPCAVGA